MLHFKNFAQGVLDDSDDARIWDYLDELLPIVLLEGEVMDESPEQPSEPIELPYTNLRPLELKKGAKVIADIETEYPNEYDYIIVYNDFIYVTGIVTGMTNIGPISELDSVLSLFEKYAGTFSLMETDFEDEEIDESKKIYHSIENRRNKQLQEFYKKLASVPTYNLTCVIHGGILPDGTQIFTNEEVNELWNQLKLLLPIEDTDLTLDALEEKGKIIAEVSTSYRHAKGAAGEDYIILFGDYVIFTDYDSGVFQLGPRENAEAVLDLLKKYSCD
jgi:hypothetical protein